MTASPQQILAQLRHEKKHLERRLDMTRKCAEVAKKIQQAYGVDGAPVLDASGLIAYTCLNIQLLQLELSVTEGEERIMELDGGIAQLTSAVVRPAFVPPGGSPPLAGRGR